VEKQRKKVRTSQKNPPGEPGGIKQLKTNYRA
jgi:hypothetical protein